jgi:hypothetical protein
MSFHIIPASARVIKALKNIGIACENVGSSMHLKFKDNSLSQVGHPTDTESNHGIADAGESPRCGDLILTTDPREVVDLAVGTYAMNYEESAVGQEATLPIVFKLVDTELRTMDDFIRLSASLDAEDGNPEEPFAMAVDCGRAFVPSTVPDAWVEAVNNPRFFFSHDQKMGILYVANIVGANISPAGMLEEAQAGTPNTTSVVEERKVPSSTRGEADTWRQTTVRFMEEPTRDNYMALITSKACKSAYKCMRSNGMDKTAEARDQFSLLKRCMRGKAKAMNYEDFAKKARGEAGTFGPARFLVSIGQIRGLLRSTEEGKIYIEA